MLSDTLPNRLYQKHINTKTGQQLWKAPQITHDIIMASHSHGLVEVVVGDTNILAPYTFSGLQVSRICRRQARFSIFGPEEINCVHVAVLFRQMSKVSLESRL